MNPIFSSHSFDFLEKIKAILCNFDEFFSPTRSSGSLCDKKDVFKPILKCFSYERLVEKLFNSIFRDPSLIRFYQEKFFVLKKQMLEIEKVMKEHGIECLTICRKYDCFHLNDSRNIQTIRKNLEFLREISSKFINEDALKIQSIQTNFQQKFNEELQINQNCNNKCVKNSSKYFEEFMRLLRKTDELTKAAKCRSDLEEIILSYNSIVEKECLDDLIYFNNEFHTISKKIEKINFCFENFLSNKRESELKEGNDLSACQMDLNSSPTIPVHNGEFIIHSNGEEPIRKSSSNSEKTTNNQVNTQSSINEIKNSPTNAHYKKGNEVISELDKKESSHLRRSFIKQIENQVNQRNLTEIDLKQHSIEKNCMCRIF